MNDFQEYFDMLMVLGECCKHYRNAQAQVRILVGCQSWTIGPRLALLWRPRFGGHSWANCGSFGFANFGELIQMTMIVEPIVGILITRFRCHCTTNCRPNYGPDSNRLSGQPWQITLDDRDSSVGPPLGHGLTNRRHIINQILPVRKSPYLKKNLDIKM